MTATAIKFGRSIYDKPKDAADDYWVIRAYLHGFAKTAIARVLGYKTAFHINDVLKRYHVR